MRRGADRLDARLLDRLEDRARLLAGRLHAPVHGLVVAGEPQRHRVGMAAHDRGFRLGQLARRLRQPRLAADHAGTLGRERHLEVRLARQRAHGAGDRALERLGRRFLGRGLRLDVGGHWLFSSFRGAPKARTRNEGQDSATFTALSGNSMPKQR